MKIFFIDCKQDLGKEFPHHIFPPLEIGYCKAILEKKGHEVDFVDLRIEDHSFQEVLVKVEKFNPDIMIIKPGEHSIDLSRKLATDCRKHTKYIFCYGPFLTVHPEFFIDAIKVFDLGIIGEIEQTLPELVDNLSNMKEIRGIVYYDNGLVKIDREYISDLDSLPQPSQEIIFSSSKSTLV